MATNSSENLGLHLWEPTDQVLRTEFNQNWTKIDTAVAEAQQTAEAAQSAAEQMPYVIGSYTGNAPDSGADPGQLIELGFRPQFLIITRGWTSNVSSTAFLVIGQERVNAQDLVFEWRESGFLVKSTNTSGPLQLNEAGMVYDYIAFRQSA